MSIVSVEVSSIHGAPDQQRMLFYTATDHEGQTYQVGPVFTTDPAFDPETYKPIIIGQLEESLAEQEFNLLVSEDV